MADKVSYELPYGDEKEAERAIAKRISKTFSVYDKVIQAVLNLQIKGALSSGAPGCGKTYGIERAINEMVAQNPSRKFHIQGGSLSPVNLYKLLWDYREAGDILVIDDCDHMFYDVEGLNLFKRAMDTSSKRVVGWGKESNVLAADGIPKDFEYRGSIMIATNIDLRAEAAKNNKFSRHQAALLDRISAGYVDLGIHTKREVFVRIYQVMQNTDFLAINGMDIPRGRLIHHWIRDNLRMIPRPSLRTVVNLNGIINNYPKEEDWKEIAEVTLFNR